MVRTSTTILNDKIDDQAFQITSLINRVKELENPRGLSDSSLIGDRNNIRWLADRVKKLENENTALSGTIHKERISQLEMNADIMRRLRTLERECSVIGDVPHTPGKSPASERKYRKYQVQKQIQEVINGIGKLNELIGPLED